MPKARNIDLSFAEKMLRLKKAGIKKTPENDKSPNDNKEEITGLNQRIQQILQLSEKKLKNSQNMLFFVMYDIEDNKVRTEIAKYLIEKGCVRIQKSIYLADLEHKVATEIYENLKAVNEVYENSDSILIVPISSDEVKSMKIIGLSIDVDLIIGNRNTLFF